jgi:hypothetical protein
VPRTAFQATDLLVTVPETLAVNCFVSSVVTDVEDGETLTELTPGTVIVTVAAAVLERSAWLKTVMVAVPALEGAVYRPVALITPAEAFQVTALFADVVCTVALN